MSTVLHKTGDIIDSRANMKYWVVNYPPGTSSTYTRVRLLYSYYLMKYNAAPKVTVISYNSTLTIPGGYGTITLMRTYNVGNDVVREYQLHDPAKFGAYVVKWSGGTLTKLLVEDIEGSNLHINDLGGIWDEPWVVVDVENVILHEKKPIIHIGDFTYDNYSSDWFFQGINVVSKLYYNGIYFSRDVQLSELKDVIACKSYIALDTGSKIHGTMTELASYINIDDYYSQNKKHKCSRLLLYENTITGTYTSFIDTLIARGARNYGFKLQHGTTPTGAPATGNGGYIDENGNYSELSASDIPSFFTD